MKEGGYIKVHEGLLVSIEPNALTLASQRTRKAFANGKEKGGRRTLEAFGKGDLSSYPSSSTIKWIRVELGQTRQPLRIYLDSNQGKPRINEALYLRLSPPFIPPSLSFANLLLLIESCYGSKALPSRGATIRFFLQSKIIFFFSKLEIMFIKFDSLKEEDKEK